MAGADNEKTIRAVESAAQELCLLVSAEGILHSHPLPETGAVTLGRGAGCEIRIDHPSVSRKHALLRLAPVLAIEDLGSANGTRVQDRPLAAGKPVRLAPGDVVDLGSVMLVVRRTQARPRRIWPHGYFEGRLAEECERHSRGGEGFAVLRLSPGGDGDHDPPLEAALAEIVGPLDVLARYAPGEYEILVAGAGVPQAEEIAARMVARLAKDGLEARTGVACCPRDGQAAESLIAGACAALRGAPAGSLEVVYQATGPKMRALLELAERVAQGTLGVLIVGETGVGKEVFAETVHQKSPRAGGTFLRLHCAAFSESLLESELFGYEKGAFTGAHAAKPGLLETAAGGTVFLDEIGELSPATQVKLLRVLEDKKILRIGGLKPRAIDVRFVAATNRDLSAEVVAGRFRRDLYFRLNGITLRIPPLRERPTEIEPLARHFARAACAQAGRRAVAIAADGLSHLATYPWPGNIRELKNAIERALLLCGDGPIRAEHLAESVADPARPPDAAPRAPAGLRQQLDALERQKIELALEECGGNQTRAAKLLSISRGTLIARLEAFGLARPRKPRPR